MKLIVNCASLQVLLFLTCLSYFKNCFPKALNCVNSYGNIVPGYYKTLYDDFKNRKSNVTVHVYIHTVTSGNWLAILLDMIFDLEQNNFYEEVASLTIGVIGGQDSDFKKGRKFVRDIGGGRFNEKITFVQTHVQDNLWEFPTINHMLTRAREIISANSTAHFLYMHTKGLNKEFGDSQVKWYWRKWMTSWLVAHHRLNRVMLDYGYDALGSNPINKFYHDMSSRVNVNHSWHYSGNFWWATAKHLSTLPLLNYNRTIGINTYERAKAENLILSKAPNMCAGLLGYSESTHFYKSMLTLESRSLRVRGVNVLILKNSA